MSKYKRNKVYIQQKQEGKVPAVNNKSTTVVQVDKEGCVVNYKYQVVFVDEYNNWYFIGFFNDLRDAEPELNSYLEGYHADKEDWGWECESDNKQQVLQFGDNTILGHLKEYPGTFSPCFDKIIDTDCGTVEVRGFIFQ